MRKFTIVLILFFSINSLSAQKEQWDYKYFLNRQFGNTYSISKKSDIKLYNRDFSILWTEKITANICFAKSFTPLTLGYIGFDFQRLYIKILNVAKINNKKYYVSGKSRVKENICDFKGYFNINQIYEYSIPYVKGIEYTIDPRSIRQGILLGDYELYEDSTQLNSGVFKGKFIIAFYIDNSDKINYNTFNCYSDSYMNNQFKGIWKSYSGTDEKTANWGNFRIPESENLDNGASEFIPSKNYIDMGWRTYIEAYFMEKQNPDAIKAEEREWWK